MRKTVFRTDLGFNGLKEHLRTVLALEQQQRFRINTK